MRLQRALARAGVASPVPPKISETAKAPSKREKEAPAPEVAIGERLFLETRFSQYFFAASKGDANHALAAGDPVMGVTATTGAALPGPFAGASMNCRGCHLVGEHLATDRKSTRLNSSHT